MIPSDTIVAQATPPGRGGVGIVRVSGTQATHIAQQIFGSVPAARQASYGAFKDVDGDIIDFGLLLYFATPNSFTGEDVVEFQGHGGPIILQRLIARICQLGARPAKPGEFSERAFHNNKIDLAQAEAIADLIDSASIQASRSAMRSLQGDFSNYINQLVEQLTQLRIYVEAALDFPEEEIDFLADGKVASDLQSIRQRLHDVIKQASAGARLREGISMVIVGEPNAGKSTLLNRLSGRDSAIVTDIPGTTRDLMQEYILLDGIPVNIIDTAGLRHSDDAVEQEGIKRARKAMQAADVLLYLHDITVEFKLEYMQQLLAQDLPQQVPVIVVMNKADRLASEATQKHTAKMAKYHTCTLSAKTGDGIEGLIEAIKRLAAREVLSVEVGFMARQRHLDALAHAQSILEQAEAQFRQHAAGELLAEDLRLAQQSLAEITGEFSSDDLLGRIFSSFCIGK